jgi:hypothetical protein
MGKSLEEPQTAVLVALVSASCQQRALDGQRPPMDYLDALELFAGGKSEAVGEIALLIGSVFEAVLRLRATQDSMPPPGAKSLVQSVKPCASLTRFRTQREGHHRFAVMACSFVVAHEHSNVGRSRRRSNRSVMTDGFGAAYIAH